MRLGVDPTWRFMVSYVWGCMWTTAAITHVGDCFRIEGFRV